MARACRRFAVRLCHHRVFLIFRGSLPYSQSTDPLICILSYRTNSCASHIRIRTQPSFHERLHMFLRGTTRRNVDDSISPPCLCGPHKVFLRSGIFGLSPLEISSPPTVLFGLTASFRRKLFCLQRRTVRHHGSLGSLCVVLLHLHGCDARGCGGDGRRRAVHPRVRSGSERCTQSCSPVESHDFRSLFGVGPLQFGPKTALWKLTAHLVRTGSDS
ncbi:hypothetical protein TGMAS_246182 [Toxoplasma gondii MAS]|uniref:Uncharacterized protein n=3 Tax=Toxoplasma gondii TaxID=5811 RepID=A0A086QUC0_TOXGO|nr:hypothetical protein TGP89_246182 [Toxoplasma gondii p89]KFH16202.1 hypothetical protein TGMAS_246182 [Toxoplasma gondii MAS]PUA90498.1 hypothetical protein TGBR9_246182 [Toxoplasma gondii TgCATBr9]